MARLPRACEDLRLLLALTSTLCGDAADADGDSDGGALSRLCLWGLALLALRQAPLAEVLAFCRRSGLRAVR